MSIFVVSGIPHVLQPTLYIFFRRRVEWRRLAVALDVAAPADLTDPDRSFLDKLPQPYRLIVSVLDTEVHI